MSDAEWVAFLQWALPRLGLRWAGFRRVRGQVEKRIRRRIAELELPDLAAYRARLEAVPDEWEVLRYLSVVTISRFHRDRAVWDAMREVVLPAAARAAIETTAGELRCWSAGCASGEEPYTLAIAWQLTLAHRFPMVRLTVLGTDVDERVLERARRAEYAGGTLRDLPASWRERAFERTGATYRLRPPFRASVTFAREDLRWALPSSTFHVILCRNLAFTYFDDALARQTLARMRTRLLDGGFLIVGRHERLPSGSALEAWDAELGIHRAPPGPPSETRESRGIGRRFT